MGAIFGIPSVRLKGLYLALTTLGAQIILTWIALFYIPLTAAGFSVEPIKIGTFAFNTPQKFYYIAMLFTVVMAFFAKNMMWAHLESFTLNDSIWYVVMIIVGGLGSIEGTIFGVIFITALKELIFVIGPMVEGKLPFLPIGAGSGLLLVIIGGVAILFLIFEPRGLAHRWNLFKAYYRLWPFGY